MSDPLPLPPTLQEIATASEQIRARVLRLKKDLFYRTSAQRSMLLEALNRYRLWDEVLIVLTLPETKEGVHRLIVDMNHSESQQEYLVEKLATLQPQQLARFEHFQSIYPPKPNQ